MDDKKLIIATSSPADPSRLHVDLAGSLILEGGWRLALLEITLGSRIRLFDAEEDYIEVGWSNTDMRDKRTTPINDIHPLKLSNYFPWINHYMSAKQLSEEEILPHLFSRSFSSREAARILDIPQNLAFTLYSGALQFCENIVSLREGGSSLDIWPSHVNTELLKRLGFTSRPFVDDFTMTRFAESLHTCVWLNILGEKTGLAEGPLWVKIYEAFFQNKILEYLHLLEFTTWEFIVELDSVLTRFHSYLTSVIVAKTNEGWQIPVPSIKIPVTESLPPSTVIAIDPVKIKNYFPWLYKYQKIQNVSDHEMINIIFSPSFPVRAIARKLHIEYSAMTVLHLGLVSFCLNITELIQGRQSNIWPENISKPLLGEIGFQVRPNINTPDLHRIFEEETLDMPWLKSFAGAKGLSVYRAWSDIYHAVFNNRLGEKALELGIAPWELMKKMDGTIARYNSHLDNLTVSEVGGNKHQLENSADREERKLHPHYSWIFGGEQIQVECSSEGGDRRVTRSAANGETQEILREIIKKHDKTFLRGEGGSSQIQLPKKWLATGRKLHFGELRDNMLTPGLICDFFNSSGFKTRACFNKTTQKIAIHVHEDESVTLHGRLASVCSLPRELVGPRIYESQYCLDPFIDFRTLFVYCDSTADIILGEQILPVIQFLAPDKNSATHVTYSEPCYIPINTRHLTKINLVIYNETGRRITFETNSPSTAKLLLAKA